MLPPRGCPTSRTCRMCSPPVECVGMWGAWATDTRYRSQQVFHKARHSASCYYDPQPTTNMRLIADLIDLSCCYFICMYIIYIYIYMNSKHFKILIRELRTGEKKTEALLLHGWDGVKNGSVAQITQCTWSISHNAPFRTEMCTFLFWIMYSRIWNRYIVGFVN